ncbi:MAG: hypothetical protein AAGE43_00340 [Pseudomonadota bacterium]
MISTAITGDIVVHTAADDVSLEQISEAMQAWYQHADFDPERPVLWDLRAVTMELERDGITPERVTSWSESSSAVINAERAGRKTAWVFGEDGTAELASELLGAYDWQHKVRIFANDMEAARAWLFSTIR